MAVAYHTLEWVAIWSRADRDRHKLWEVFKNGHYGNHAEGYPPAIFIHAHLHYNEEFKLAISKVGLSNQSVHYPLEAVNSFQQP